MKKLILPIALLSSVAAFSQVGINNTDPKATLDVTAKTTDGSKPEGFIAPRLTGDQIRSGNASYTAAQAGTIIYATAADSAPAGKTINIIAPGYYYFDGSIWQKVGSGAFAGDTTNDIWVNDTGLVKLGTKADGTARAAYTDVVANDNGYIGMGTSTPGNRIDIIGDGGSNDDINLNSSGNTSNFAGGITFIRSQGTPAAKTAVTSGNSLGSLSFNGYDGSGNLNTAAVSAQINGTVATGSAPTDLTFSAGTNAATERMRITSGGNVGIGTNAPSNILHVNAASNPVRFEGLVTGAGTSNIVTVDANGVLTKSATTASSLAASDTTNDIWVNDTGLVKLGTKSDGTARAAYTDVVANDNGYLGMGTSTPGNRIDIVGDGGFNDDISLSSSGNSAFAGSIAFIRSQGTPVAKTAVTSGSYLGTLSFNGYDGTSNLSTAGIGAQVNGTVATGSAPTDLMFYSGTNGAIERMRINSGGNVGIGTTTPTTKLDVQGKAFLRGTAVPSGTVNLGIGTDSGSQRWGVGTENTESGSNAGADFRIWNYADDSSYIGNVFAITRATGNIGVGVTSPSNRLHVNAASNPVRFEGLVTGAGTSNIVTVDSNGVLTKSATTASALAGADMTNDIWVNDSTNNIVKLGTKADGTTARGAYTDVVANDNGSIGMGTTAPGSRIDIIGQGGLDDDINVRSSGNTSSFAGGITFSRSQGTPAAKTSVATGNSLGSLSFNAYDGTSSINTAAIAAQINGTVAAGSTPTDLTFSAGDNAATERMRITSAGNVGIGTGTPNVKLEINSGTSGQSGMRFTNLTSSSSVSPGTSKNLSVDSSGNVILSGPIPANAVDLGLFAAAITSDRPVRTAGGSLQTVVYQAENADAANAFVPTTGIYTVPSAGYYTFTTSVQFDNTVSGGNFTQCGLVIRRNSSSVITTVGQQFVIVTTKLNSLTSTGLVYCNAGDTIYVETLAYVDSGTTYSLAARNFQGWKISN